VISTTCLVAILATAAAVPAKSADAPPSPAENSAEGSTAAIKFIVQADLNAPTKQAMQTVLEQHPTELRWAGRSGDSLFAVAAKRLPKGDLRTRSTPALLEVVHMQAVQELLTAKSLLDQFDTAGLNDATTLRGAVEEAAGTLHVTGDVQGVIHQAAKVGDFVIGYVIADESGLSGYLLQPAELEIVRTAYRNVMHRQARELMARGDWENALLLWNHLHKRALVSQQLYLDAARCFQALKQPDAAMKILTEAFAAFATSGSAVFFEQAGDLALDIPTEAAQTLAETAYTKASEALKQTISGPQTKK
jgi:tetratricopeptide (TPR) repeat protein